MFLAACCKFTCDGRSGFKLLYCYKRRRVITTTDVIMFGNYGLTPFLHIVIAWNLVFSLNWSWHFISNAFPLEIINYGQLWKGLCFSKQWPLSGFWNAHGHLKQKYWTNSQTMANLKKKGKYIHRYLLLYRQVWRSKNKISGSDSRSKRIWSYKKTAFIGLLCFIVHVLQKHNDMFPDTIKGWCIV